MNIFAFNNEGNRNYLFNIKMFKLRTFQWVKIRFNYIVCFVLHSEAFERVGGFISSVQLLSHVWLFATPWTAAREASLSITNSRSLFKLMSIMSVMSSNLLILCHPLLLPSIFSSIRVFSNESALCSGQSIGVSASTSVLPMNIQDWFPLRLTGWISLQSKGLSSVFSNTTVQKHQFFSTQLFSPSNSHIHTWLLEKLD